MKPFLLIPALALVVAWFCPAFMLPCVAGENATLFGRVVEQRTREPFEGVVVELSGTLFWTRTDAHGQFVLQNLAAGTYRFLVRIPEWGDFEKIIRLRSDPTVTNDVVVWPGLHTNIPGVLAYYPMDGTAADLGPNSWNGVDSGATATTDRNGMSDGAMHFGGRTQRIVVAHHDRLNELPLSIAFWVKVETDVTSHLLPGSFPAASRQLPGS